MNEAASYTKSLRYGCAAFSFVAFVLAVWIFAINWIGSRRSYEEMHHSGITISGLSSTNVIHEALLFCALLMFISFVANFFQAPQRLIFTVAVATLVVVAYQLTGIEDYVRFVDPPEPVLNFDSHEELMSRLRPLLRVFSIFVGSLVLMQSVTLAFAIRDPDRE